MPASVAPACPLRRRRGPHPRSCGPVHQIAGKAGSGEDQHRRRGGPGDRCGAPHQLSRAACLSLPGSAHRTLAAQSHPLGSRGCANRCGAGRQVLAQFIIAGAVCCGRNAGPQWLTPCMSKPRRAAGASASSTIGTSIIARSLVPGAPVAHALLVARRPRTGCACRLSQSHSGDDALAVISPFATNTYRRHGRFNWLTGYGCRARPDRWPGDGLAAGS
jgi:hypothetical protein